MNQTFRKFHLTSPLNLLPQRSPTARASPLGPSLPTLTSPTPFDFQQSPLPPPPLSLTMHASGVGLRRRVPDPHKAMPLLRDLVGLTFDEAGDLVVDELTSVRARASRCVGWSWVPQCVRRVSEAVRCERCAPGPSRYRLLRACTAECTQRAHSRVVHAGCHWCDGTCALPRIARAHALRPLARAHAPSLRPAHHRRRPRRA